MGCCARRHLTSRATQQEGYSCAAAAAAALRLLLRLLQARKLARKPAGPARTLPSKKQLLKRENHLQYSSPAAEQDAHPPTHPPPTHNKNLTMSPEAMLLLAAWMPLASP